MSTPIETPYTPPIPPDDASSSQSLDKIPKCQPKASALNIIAPSPPRMWKSHATDDSALFSPTQFFHDQPDVSHFQFLTASLLFTTLLALLSAYDAKNECLHKETYALLYLVDDDNFQQAFQNTIENGDHLCMNMYREVVAPTAAVTVILGVAAFVLLTRARRAAQFTTLNLTPMYRLAKQLFFFHYIPLFIMQVYNVAEIMLVPRGDLSSGENPYQSLAAVDRSGYIGDNANLFYMTWFSFGFALILAYQSGSAYLRLRRRHQSATALLPATSWDLATTLLNTEARTQWFKNIYKLRIRTGFWVAALISCAMIVCSSQYIVELLIPYSTRMGYHQICRVYSNETGKSIEYCRRTVVAWISGAVAAFLCGLALCLHHWARSRQLNANENMDRLVEGLRQKRLPLNTELVLSLVLTLILGFNAVYSTGVRGPAAAVGNLYYSCWLAFFLCGRICLGCLEEACRMDSDDELKSSTSQGSNSYEAPSLERPPVPSKTLSSSVESCVTEVVDRERASRMRKYFFLSIFSLVTCASAWDAATHQGTRLTVEQRYMMYAPAIVSALALLSFLACFSKIMYTVTSHFFVGGVLSIVSFGLWLGNLILTMHSEHSWAVDSIGEVKNANLYYYSWAAIITAGVQMTSYVTSFLGVKEKDSVTVAWLAICKVCFVILGASMHVWHTISGNCDFDEITSGAVTFCSRTVLAMIVSLCGVLIGGLITAIRVLTVIFPLCGCARFQAHIELLISMFFVCLFGAATAMITGIGGPGQSVGDLYYSTWLSFWVSIWIFFSCFAQISMSDGKGGSGNEESPSTLSPSTAMSGGVYV